MVIGLPKEIKDRENRVAATPSGVRELASNGHQVLVESGAGWAVALLIRSTWRRAHRLSRQRRMHGQRIW